MRVKNRYEAIIEAIFHSKFRPGARQVEFERTDLERFAKKLKIALPKNLGDLIYSFRYRTKLPNSIRKLAPPGDAWQILSSGRSKYRFVLGPYKPFSPNRDLSITKVPDCTPGFVTKYALSDEQALLAKLRYNRLVDIFTGITCYSLQNHLRTTAPGIGQAETDELYLGVDRKGVHYVLPVQAKGGKDSLSFVQSENDFAVCRHKFPSLVCRGIAAQFMPGDVVALFELELEKQEGRATIVNERHYKLVPPEEVTAADLELYKKRKAE